jgi:hypothetical protein
MVAVAVLCAGPIPAANAATQIGQTFPPVTGCGAGTYIQTTSPGGQYAAPSSGVITAWSFQASATPPSPIKLKVVRPVGGTLYTVVGESSLASPVASQLNTFGEVRVPVQTGDLIGYFVPISASGACGIATGPAYEYSVPGSLDPSPGTTTTFTPDGNAQLDVSATLEPDLDADGFGDETQDQCPTDGSLQAACADTTISGGPKDKTRKKRATFVFTSNVPDASFQCAVDGQALKVPCTSPYKVKVKRGRHTFQVRAVSPGGVPDPTPSTDDWKVKKKKR